MKRQCVPRKWTHQQPYFAQNLIGKRIRTSPILLDFQGVSGFVLIITYGHTFATVALQNGVDIKAISGMLGHYSDGQRSLQCYLTISRHFPVWVKKWVKTESKN